MSQLAVDKPSTTRALSDDALVDRAAETNARLAAERLDYSVIQPQVVEIYRGIASEIEAQRG